jgi:protein SCO1/2
MALMASCACSTSREYEVRGQVLVVNRERQEITIKHEDIRGFMPAMTMPFKVRRLALLDGIAAGDLVTAALVVEDNAAYLTAISKTGSAPLTEAPPLPLAATLQPGDEVPALTATDQQGASFSLASLRGRVVAVTFIYTRCPLPDFCPLMDRHFAAVQRELTRDPALRARAQLVSVSFDPVYDTPTVLGEHARRAGAEPSLWRFVTGEREAIDRFAAAFGVSIIREDADLKEIVHNLRTAVIDPGGRLVTILPGNEWTPAQLLDAMRRAGA